MKSRFNPKNVWISYEFPDSQALVIKTLIDSNFKRPQREQLDLISLGGLATFILRTGKLVNITEKPNYFMVDFSK